MSLRRSTVALLLFTFDISPLCDVAHTSDCGMFVFYFQYKPFMWCLSDVRLWHVRLLFSVISPLRDVAQTSDCGMFVIYFRISPLCDVAQTSDCGKLVIYFWYKPFLRCRSDVRLWHVLSFIFYYKPFMWCRPDARLRHCYSCIFLSRSHSDPRLAPSI